MNEYSIALEFFSKILSKAPDQKLLQYLIQDQMIDHWPIPSDDEQSKRALELVKSSLQGDSEYLQKQLKEDYFSLFEMSPARCHIHESVWLGNDRLLNDEQTFAVRSWYAKYGLQAVSSDRGPDDHLALELSFVAYLLNRLDEEQEGQHELLTDLHHFLDEHLMKWGPQCLEKISQKAETDFYQGIGMLASETLLKLTKQLNK